MRISDVWLRRLLAGCLVMLLAVPFGDAATTRAFQASAGEAGTGVSSASSQRADTQPQTPAATPQTEAVPGNANTVRPETSQPNPSPNPSQAVADQPQSDTSKPVGTAAAPYEKTLGAAVSRPAGAVIAPAKQKRARSFLIRVGLILGAAAAVGIVVGLSAGSPSRPN